MSARDDYPLGRTDVTYTIDPGIWKDLCDEIDRLREANKFLSNVLDDVLPTLPITDASIVKVDGHWIRITPKPIPTDGGPTFEARILT